MSLADRVKAAKEADAESDNQREETRKDLRRKLHFKVVEGLGPTLYDRQMSDAELKLRVMEMLEWALDQEQSVALTRTDRLGLLQEIADDVLGYGPIDPFLADPEVTEVMVNGPHAVWIERHGQLTRTDTRFVDATHLERIIEKIVGQVGRRIDESNPMVDARLPDGSRVNAIIHPSFEEALQAAKGELPDGSAVPFDFRPTIDDSIEHRITDRHREDATGGSHLVALLDVRRFTHQHRADGVLVEVEGQADGAVLDLTAEGARSRGSGHEDDREGHHDGVHLTGVPTCGSGHVGTAGDGQDLRRELREHLADDVLEGEPHRPHGEAHGSCPETDDDGHEQAVRVPSGS